MRLAVAWFAVSVPFVSSCSSLPPPAPTDTQSAGLCIAVSTRAPIAISSNDPDTVLFLKLPDSGEPDFQHGVATASNFHEDGYAYLLNAEPGRYVAVACYRAQESQPAAPPKNGLTIGIGPGSTDYTTYFPIDMIKATQVEVKPHAITFMGSYVVDQAVGLDGADAVQMHYYRALAPGDEQRSGFSKLMSGNYHYRGKLHASDHGEAASAKFHELATADLGQAGWSPMLQ